MESKHVINITGVICPPRSEEAYNRWMDEAHIPLLLKFKGLDEVRRYKLQHGNGLGTAREYPTHLTFFRFKDLATLKSWQDSPERAAAHQGAPELLSKLGIKILWRAQFQSIGIWQQNPPTCVIDIIGMLPTPETAPRLNEWYITRHIPDMLKYKGCLGAIRYERASDTPISPKQQSKVKGDDYPRFLAVYHYRDLAAAEAFDKGPERVVSYQGWIDIEKEIHPERKWRVRFSPLRSWQR